MIVNTVEHGFKYDRVWIILKMIQYTLVLFQIFKQSLIRMVNFQPLIVGFGNVMMLLKHNRFLINAMNKMNTEQQQRGAR